MSNTYRLEKGTTLFLVCYSNFITLKLYKMLLKFYSDYSFGQPTHSHIDREFVTALRSVDSTELFFTFSVRDGRK